MAKFYTNVAKRGDYILLRGYEDGKRVQKTVPYKPYLFVQSQNESKYKTIDGRPVTRKDFDGIRAAREFAAKYENVEGMALYGLTNYEYTYIYDNYLGDVEYDQSLISVVGLDIETDMLKNVGFPDVTKALNEVTLITISRNGKKVCFGCGDFNNETPDTVTYYKCKDEYHLLKCFLEIWNSSEFSPDIVTGWNIEFFDIPYLVNRITRVIGEQAAKKLSPWGVVQEGSTEVMGKDNQTFTLWGIAVLDYLQLYRKFSFTPQERYTLDHICFQELGERKLDYGEYGNLRGLQEKSWQTYCLYNIRDVDLVDRLDDKLKLIDLVLAMAYDAKVNFADAFTTVRLWDVIIHNYLMDTNRVIHQYQKPTDIRKIVGGYVKEPQTGKFNWVVSFDLTSLYPHLIMQYGISPECHVGHFTEHHSLQSLLDGKLDNTDIKAADLALTANMQLYSRAKQGFLPALMSKMYDDRKVFKDKMIAAKKKYEAADPNSDEAKSLLMQIAQLDKRQMAKKIQLNGGYGALANVWNRWYDTVMAEAITMSGQLSTMWIERKLNEYVNKICNTTNVDYVIACDTDSVYICLDTLVSLVFKDKSDTKKIVAFLDDACKKKFDPYINKCFTELADYMNAKEQKMYMKRECIADKAIWVAAKHYILNVYNQEGVAYDKPHLKMQGIEAVRSSTPQICRDAIEASLNLIMNDTEESLHNYIQKFRSEFMVAPFEDVASPRGVNGMETYHDSKTVYKKGTPIAVKGALIYNQLLKDKNLVNQYEAIESGNKAKFSYMKMPNPARCAVITCPLGLPPEFGLDRYIDREKQLQKTFIGPMEGIVDAAGWTLEKKFSLEDFYS